jgi:hypothetical protein
MITNGPPKNAPMMVPNSLLEIPVMIPPKNIPRPPIMLAIIQIQNNTLMITGVTMRSKLKKLFQFM